MFELAGVGAGCSLFNVICCLIHSFLVNKVFFINFYLILSSSYVAHIYFLEIFVFCLFGGSLSLLVFALHKFMIFCTIFSHFCSVWSVCDSFFFHFQFSFLIFWKYFLPSIYSIFANIFLFYIVRPTSVLFPV